MQASYSGSTELALHPELSFLFSPALFFSSLPRNSIESRTSFDILALDRCVAVDLGDRAGKVLSSIMLAPAIDGGGKEEVMGRSSRGLGKNSRLCPQRGPLYDFGGNDILRSRNGSALRSGGDKAGTDVPVNEVEASGHGVLHVVKCFLVYSLGSQRPTNK